MNPPSNSPYGSVNRALSLPKQGATGVVQPEPAKSTPRASPPPKPKNVTSDKGRAVPVQNELSTLYENKEHIKAMKGNSSPTTVDLPKKDTAGQDEASRPTSTGRLTKKSPRSSPVLKRQQGVINKTNPRSPVKEPNAGAANFVAVNVPKARSFSLHDDDSSDEEKSAQIASEYEFDKKLSEFIEDSRFKGNVDLNYSFMLHAIGIKILYSQEVNNNYYAAAKTKLREDKELVTEASGYLTTACSQTVSEFLTSIWEHDNTKTPIYLKEIIQPTLAVVSQNKSQFIQVIVDNLFQTNVPIDVVKDFCGHVKNELIKQIDRAVFISNPEFDPNEVNIPGLTNLLLDILKKEGFAAHSNYWRFTTKIKNIKDYNFEKYGNLKNTLTALQALDKLSEVSSRSKALYFDNEPQRSQLAKAFLEDIKNFQPTDVEKISEHINPKAYLPIMVLLKPECQKHVANRYIESNFDGALYSKLCATLNSRKRPTLGNHYEFSPDGYVGFFSHVRLSNRSQIREIKNYKNSPVSDSKVFYPKENVYRIWSLFNSKALERLSVFSGNQKGGSRKDMVDSAGSYLEISDVLEGYKIDFEKKFPNLVNDALMATWIKEIISGKDKLTDIDDEFYISMYGSDAINTLKEKLVGITYLLFGCEVARNPASIPIHHMMLELIINKRLSFKDALTPTLSNGLEHGGRMPMSAKGAIAAGRKLNNDFSQYLPYQYKYPGNDNPNEKQGISDTQMVACEKWILSEWLKLKDYPPVPDSVDIEHIKNIFYHVKDEMASVMSK